MLFSSCLFVYNARNSLGAQIAPKSLSAGASPLTPLGELTALPRPPSWIQGALLLRLLLLRSGEGRGGDDPEKLCTPKNSLEYALFDCVQSVHRRSD